MCTGMKYECLRKGDFACTHGDKNLATSRNMKILLHGSVSIRAPVPPYEMLNIIEEIISNMEANNGVYDPNLHTFSLAAPSKKSQYFTGDKIEEEESHFEEE